MPSNNIARRRKNNTSSVAVNASVARAPVANENLSRGDAQRELEAQFCPPLDGSLVAAILSEYSGTELSTGTLSQLRATLTELASVADVPKENDRGPSPRSHAFFVPAASSKDGVESDLDSFSMSDSHSLSQLDTQSSLFSTGTFSSPLGFLQAVFPHLPNDVFEKALSTAAWTSRDSGDEREINMDAVVNTLLSEEYIRELIERGYVPDEQGSDDDDGHDQNAEKGWELVQKRQKNAGSGNVDTNGLGPRKGKRIKPAIIPLVDTRQRQHIPPSRPAAASSLPAPDPWLHIVSLASHLCKLVPSTTYAQFLALFHNPTYKTPVVALRAHLATVAQRSTQAIDENDVQTLIELVPIDLDEHAVRGNLTEDAHACLAAVSGRMEDAYDLLLVLRDLDVDGAVIRHSLPTKLSRPSSTTPSTPVFARTDDHHSKPTSIAQSSTPIPPIKPKQSVPDPNAWQTVTRRDRPAHPESEGLAAFIPAYRQGKMQAAATDDPAECRRWADEYRTKRDTALRQASSHWQRGRQGAEVALYYAEEARGFDAHSRQWAMRGAHAHVKQYRRARDVIDLHGLTVQESIVVARECVYEWSSGGSPSGSFTIITGVGKHSNGPAVLAPAVQKALESDGWRVRKEYGQLIVASR